MQGFVGGIGHHESKRLLEKFAKLDESAITFESFLTGIKGISSNAASLVYSEFIYLC